ncbi:MAG: ABC transporter permease [Microbacteriaceae bacterium]|nr:ABC transporter permease [Microbacteriaceae bacterium]NBR77456.1 ABC transporter permease [Microbacteriaceae bacterium]NBS61574.1 ABC transporter permease [Microbacteriaceae bacterium]
MSTKLYSKPKLRLRLLLSAPVTWLGLVYIAALLALLVTAFYTVDSFTGNLVPGFSLDNFASLFTNALYSTVTLRTVGIALAVTIVDVLLALPVAFFMAKVASPRARGILVISILMPLWASYLVKAYAWRSVLSNVGIFAWLLRPIGLDTPGYSLLGAAITLGYLWLPYVILPIYASLEKVPNNLLEASSDLGAKTWSTLRRVVWPLILPGVVAGSIFSFSLTLGDYITVNIVGGANQMLGNLVYANVGVANNLPMAAAIALVPVIIMFGYLTAVRKSGALDNL